MLVHFMEPIVGYFEALLRFARKKPTAHYLWMLARYVNAGTNESSLAREVLVTYLTHPSAPSELREMVSDFLATDGQQD